MIIKLLKLMMIKNILVLEEVRYIFKNIKLFKNLDYNAE